MAAHELVRHNVTIVRKLVGAHERPYLLLGLRQILFYQLLLDDPLEHECV